MLQGEALSVQGEEPSAARRLALQRGISSATRRLIFPGKYLLSVFSFSIILFCICRKDDNQHQDVDNLRA